MIPGNTSFETLIFTLVIVIWIVSEVIGAAIIPIFRRHGHKIKREDKGSRIVISFGVYFSVALAFFLAFQNIAQLPVWTFYPGLVFILFGTIIRQWSIALLGRFFSVNVGTQKDQKIVKNGPYKLVRHPSYTGILLIEIGIGLALQTWAGILIMIVVFCCVFGYRIHVEEKFLMSEFGDEYVEYMRSTKKLFPYLL